MIRRMVMSDYEQISEIIKSVFFKPGARQNGFLTYHTEKQELIEIIQKSRFCYVLEQENEIRGFLIAYPGKLIKPCDEIDEYFVNNFNDDYIYIYQIGIDAKLNRKGLGRQLYIKLFEDAKGKTIRVISSAKPHNLASEKFHMSMGFKKIGMIKRNDGGSSFVYERREC